MAQRPTRATNSHKRLANRSYHYYKWFTVFCVISSSIPIFQTRRLANISIEPATYIDQPIIHTTMPRALINTAGMIQGNPLIRGNRDLCIDVIYTCDGRAPIIIDHTDNISISSTKNKTIVDASWAAMITLSHLPQFNSTCFAFYHLSDAYFASNGSALHTVWGRLPVTSLVLDSFPKARYMLYLDTDAMLSSARYTPMEMHQQLASLITEEDSKNDEMIQQQKERQFTPSLIVNKPMTGWLCNQCMYFNLGHGCFNTGALLWRRSKEMERVLLRWWDSRLDAAHQNLYLENGDASNQTRPFYGWTSEATNTHKMSEQNRLMYLFHTELEIQQTVWPVPRKPSRFTNTTSCPEDVPYHNPCLQNDRGKFGEWDAMPACFINHYADRKMGVFQVLDLMMNGVSVAK
jgi:hypothetical protein